MIHDFIDFENDNGSKKDNDSVDNENIDKDDFEQNNTDDTSQSIQVQIVQKIPELLLIHNSFANHPLDLDKIIKKTSDASQAKVVFPDLTQEILNHDVEDIIFPGYNSVDIEQPNYKKQDNSQESYEKWLSQHKAIVKSSGKQNMSSKAPSLKNLKENSGNTKFIKLDINKPIEKPQAELTYPVPPKDEETVEIKASDRKPKTQYIPNSPAPMPDFNLQKKKTFGEKLKDSKKDMQKKKNPDDEDIFGIPPTPE